MRRFDGSLALHGLLLLGMLAGLPVATAAAQERGDAGAEEGPPRYTVELIVFTYDEGVPAGSEIFVPEPLPEPNVVPEEQRPAVFGDPPSSPVSAPAGEEPVMPDNATDEPPGEAEISGFDRDLADIPLRARIELHTLPPEKYSMNAIYDKLVELDAYHPIMRAAWTQTTPPPEASPAIRLRALGDPPPGLDGTVKLYQGRFVHLGVDIALDAQSAALEGGAYDARSATDRAIADSGIAGDARDGAAPGWSDDRVGAADGVPARPLRWRISEVRIMKDGNIRYYDHPRFGVIAKVTKVEEEEPETADDDTGAFAGGN